MFKIFIEFVKDLYKTNELIPLHEPKFIGNESNYVLDAIESSFVSTNVGEYVSNFEDMLCDYTGSKFAVTTVNGTSALHMALLINGIKEGQEVITQSLTFVSTCNAISYVGASPIFVDVNKENLSLSATALKEFIEEYTFKNDQGELVNKKTKKLITACIPMHTFGFPADILSIKKICQENNLVLIEDAAESIGSYYQNQHTGTIGDASILSFNGNKVITTGGGGMLLTNNERLANLAKHLTTQARKKHAWSFDHDMIGYNYRLPNLNAAMGCAQMEMLTKILEGKRTLANNYLTWGKQYNSEFVREATCSKANYWLNTLITKDIEERDEFLEKTNSSNIMTRPVWKPMHELEMYKSNQRDSLKNTSWLSERIVNVPSTPII